jgi:LacI family transcriptional regulator
MAPGIRNIAKHLGVSVTTESAVINRRGYISPEMKERIEKYLREVDYQPNLAARSLRRRETRMVGLVVPDLANSFYSQLCRGAEDYLLRRDYQLIVADSRENWKRQVDYLTAFNRMRTDGILLVPSLATDEQILQIPKLVRGQPLVYVDRSPLNSPVDAVMIDNREAARTATQLLIDLGHRRLAIITEPLNLLSAKDRLDGYLKALQDSGIPVDPGLICTGENTKESAYRLGLLLLDRQPRPSAAVICNNLMTLGFLSALHMRSVRCPEEISMIGFDDCEWCEHIHPPLTTIQAPAREMGAAAAGVLLHRMTQPNGQAPRTTVLGFHVQERASCRPLLE